MISDELLENLKKQGGLYKVTLFADDISAIAAELLHRREADRKLPDLLRRWALSKSTEQAYIIEDYINRELFYLDNPDKRPPEASQ